MSLNGREFGKLVRFRGGICDSPVGWVEQRTSRFLRCMSVGRQYVPLNYSWALLVQTGWTPYLYKRSSVCFCRKFKRSKHTSVSYFSVFNVSKRRVRFC